MVYAYLFWLAGVRVNYALVHVENKFDVARTLGGALMCLTVPLATYQVSLPLLLSFVAVAADGVDAASLVSSDTTLVVAS